MLKKENHSRQMLIATLLYMTCGSLYANDIIGINSDRSNSDRLILTTSTTLTQVADTGVSTSRFYQIPGAQQQTLLLSGPVSENITHYETLDSSVNAEYRVSDKWSVSGSLSAYANRQTSTDNENIVTTDSGFSRLGVGAAYELTQCNCELSLNVPLSEVVSINGASKKMSGMSMTVAGKWYVPIDPVVFSVEGSTAIRRPLEVDGTAVDLGNSYVLGSSVNFAVNEKVTLSGGVEFSGNDAQSIGDAISAPGLSMGIQFGVGYMFNSSKSLFVGYSQTSDQNAAQISASLSFGL